MEIQLTSEAWETSRTPKNVRIGSSLAFFGFLNWIPIGFQKQDGSRSRHAYQCIVFYILFVSRSVVGACARGEIDIVTNNSRTP